MRGIVGLTYVFAATMLLTGCGVDKHVPTGVVFHEETLYRPGLKGDNWCTTWAADNSQITSMDDGDWLGAGHIYGTNRRHRLHFKPGT